MPRMEAALRRSNAEEPMVCRLLAGAKRIRTVSPTCEGAPNFVAAAEGRRLDRWRHSPACPMCYARRGSCIRWVPQSTGIPALASEGACSSARLVCSAVLEQSLLIVPEKPTQAFFRSLLEIK